MVVEGFWKVLKTYTGDTSFLVLTLLAIVYIYTIIQSEDDKKLYRRIMIALIVCCYNPFSYILIGKLGGKDTYYRFLWILSSTIVMSMAICIFVRAHSTKKGSQILLGIVLVGICVLGGGLRIDGDTFKAPDNRWKLDQDMVFAIDLLHEIDEDGNIMTVGDLDYIVRARQYDAGIGIAVGRDIYIGKCEANEAQNYIVDVTLGRNYPDEELFLLSMDRLGIEYIVARYDVEKDLYLMKCGLECYEVEGSYCVYKYNLKQ